MDKQKTKEYGELISKRRLIHRLLQNQSDLELSSVTTNEMDVILIRMQRRLDELEKEILREHLMGHPRATIDTETYVALQEERYRQHNKFGHKPIATPTQMITILTEELGEVARAVNQDRPLDAEKELTQLAACCIAYIENDLHFGNEA